LEDFPEDHLFRTDFEKFKDDMKTRMADPEAWHAQFEGLDFLRKMNKYHNELLMDNIEFFC